MAKWSEKNWKKEPAAPFVPSPAPELPFRASCGPKVFYFRAKDMGAAVEKAYLHFRHDTPQLGFVRTELVVPDCRIAAA
jgi:hypothetical protein